MGQLWSRTCGKANTACPFGCPGIQPGDPHVCPRLTAGPVVFRDHYVYASLEECARQTLGAVLLHKHGPIVRVREEGCFESPTRLQVLGTSITTAVVARTTYSHPNGPDVVQHALLLPGIQDEAPLFPKEAHWYNHSCTTVAAHKTATLDGNAGWSKLGDWHPATLMAVHASTCARRRWAGVFAAEPYSTAPDKACTTITPKHFFGTINAPAAYTDKNGGVVCGHCGTFHTSKAKYVAVCAPEHASIL